MLLEALVAGLCIGDYACDKAFKAYYYERPHLRALSKEVKKQAVAQVGEAVVYTVPAFMAAMAGHSYQVKLGKRWSIGQSRDETRLTFRLDF